MTRTHASVAVVAAMLLLAGCGTTPGDRGLSGAGIGAATGAVAGAMVGAPLVGAAIGAATSPYAIDLGPPVWNQ